MALVTYDPPGDSLPELPSERARLDESFRPAIRQKILSDLRQEAARRDRHVFIATEDNTLSAIGLTEVHEVTSIRGRQALLSRSHARHRLAENVPLLHEGETYQFAIDPASNVILEASPSPQPAKPLGIPVALDLVDITSTLVPVTLDAAKRFFSIVERQPHIPFQYPANGCWARAHEMCRLIEHHIDQNAGDVTAKIWHYGELSVVTDNTPECSVGWGFHVAPVVKVDGEWLVIDPALFDQPVSVDRWLSRQQPDPTAFHIFTSRHIFHRKLSGGLFIEIEGDTEEDLQKFRVKLIAQIYEHGPIPYSCNPEVDGTS